MIIFLCIIGGFLLYCMDYQLRGGSKPLGFIFATLMFITCYKIGTISAAGISALTCRMLCMLLMGLIAAVISFMPGKGER